MRWRSSDDIADLLRWYCGEAVSVTAHALGDDPYQEDGLMALITFDTNATGALVAARTRLLLDWILSSAGLPQDEDAGREWTSHAR